MTIRRISPVFLGGGLGACARALLLQSPVVWSAPFPLSVLLINLLGSFLLGVVFVLADEAEVMRSETRLFVAVGILGSFTTFSTFGWETVVLSEGRHYIAGVSYVTASLVGGVLAVVAGIVAGREAVKALGRMTHRAFLDRGEGRAVSPADDMDHIETENHDSAELA